MRNANDPVKKVILSMSDLHLDCDWSKGMHERLYQFITKLASVAEIKYAQGNIGCRFTDSSILV